MLPSGPRFRSRGLVAALALCCVSLTAAQAPQERHSAASDEAAAEKARSDYVRTIAPEEWKCYVEARHPSAKRYIFVKVFGITTMLATGVSVPDDALAPSCARRDLAKGALGQVARSAGAALLSALKQLMREAVRFPGGADAAANAIYASLARRAEPEISRASPLMKVQTAAAIVAASEGDEAAKTFASDKPMSQARTLATAAIRITENARWPAVWMLATVDAAEGVSFSMMLKERYGPDHPDSMQWPKMSEREKGEAVRRYYVGLWKEAVRTANGEQPADVLARHWNIRSLHDESIISAVYGSDMVRRHREASNGGAVQPGYTADEIAAAACIIAAILPNLASVLQ